MLVIRMQRTGRSGHAQFRVVVQDSRRTPTSGRIVASLGAFNPHTKQTTLDKEKASFYLEHGAQPSERVARLLKSEGVKLPKWVTLEKKQKGEVRNPEKRRSTRPDEPAAKETPAAPVAEEAPAAEPAEAVSEEASEAQPSTSAEADSAAAPASEEIAPTEETPVAEAVEEASPTEEPSEPEVAEKPEDTAEEAESSEKTAA